MNEQAHTSTASGVGEPLDELRRAELLAHTRYPRLGNWYPPLFGLVVGVWVASNAAPLWVQGPVWVLILVGAAATVTKYNSMRGIQPDPFKAPAPIRREMNLFIFGSLALGALIVAVGFSTTWWLAGIVAAVGATAGIALYESRYAAAAAQAEAAAGISSPVS